jgi:endonuclease-3
VTNATDITTATGTGTSTGRGRPSRGEAVEIEHEGPSRTKKVRRKAESKPSNGHGEVDVHPPANWEAMYDAVKEMRKTIRAPVDTMGCASLADKTHSPKASTPPSPIRQPLTTPPQDQRFQTLIALMLSSQTKDASTALAIRQLQTSLPAPGLTLANILAVPPARLNELIHPVGFHNTKTRAIKATALILRDRFDGDIPATLDGLLSLPGVGPKMAYLCLGAAWGRTEGIGVDVHVHRITNLWGWHRTKGPEDTRRALQAWLPRNRWAEINPLLVGFGQTTCLPVGRRCGECVLGVGRLCPSAVVGAGKGGRARKLAVREGAGVKTEEDAGMRMEEAEVEIKAELKVEVEAEGVEVKAEREE